MTHEIRSQKPRGSCRGVIHLKGANIYGRTIRWESYPVDQHKDLFLSVSSLYIGGGNNPRIPQDFLRGRESPDIPDFAHTGECCDKRDARYRRQEFHIRMMLHHVFQTLYRDHDGGDEMINDGEILREIVLKLSRQIDTTKPSCAGNTKEIGELVDERLFVQNAMYFVLR